MRRHQSKPPDIFYQSKTIPHYGGWGLTHSLRHFAHTLTLILHCIKTNWFPLSIFDYRPICYSCLFFFTIKTFRSKITLTHVSDITHNYF